MKIEKYEYTEDDRRCYQVHAQNLMNKFIKERDDEEKKKLEFQEENCKLNNEIKKLKEEYEKMKMQLLNLENDFENQESYMIKSHVM